MKSDKIRDERYQNPGKVQRFGIGEFSSINSNVC